MKVLVHMNHGSDKSYLLSFDREMTAKGLKVILEDTDPDHAIERLMLYSAGRVEVKPKDRHKAEGLANFTISQHGCTLERLT